MHSECLALLDTQAGIWRLSHIIASSAHINAPPFIPVDYRELHLLVSAIMRSDISLS
jgi:hypothetical protein